MAARENQGLQIALIIFVILTIILIVTTYMFFSSYTQERDRANAATDAKQKADQAASTAIAETEEIKLIVGGDPQLTVAAVQEAKLGDMQSHGEGLPESKQNYRGLVEHMAAKIHEQNSNIVQLTSQVAELNTQLKTNQDAAQAEVAEYKAKLDQTQADLESERTKFGSDRNELTGRMEQLASKFQSTEAEREKLVQKTASQITSLRGELKQTEDRLVRVLEKDEADKKANEYPDGHVTRVNQRSRLVWIDVGTADGLRNQTSFVIVAPEDGNPIRSTPKAKIQVVRLTDDHQAEARIVEDDLSNPIMTGDNIFSTVWDAGRSEHFALAGKMDIDGNGGDDRQLVHDLITLNGGIVDAQVNDDGQKVGEMSVNTKYLVVGTRPDAEAKDVEGYSAMKTEAQKLGVKEMDVQEFLDYMGYQGQERTVKLGRSADPSDFKPRLPENVQRTVRGTGLPQENRKVRGAPAKP